MNNKKEINEKKKSLTKEIVEFMLNNFPEYGFLDVKTKDGNKRTNNNDVGLILVLDKNMRDTELEFTPQNPGIFSQIFNQIQELCDNRKGGYFIQLKGKKLIEK